MSAGNRVLENDTLADICSMGGRYYNRLFFGRRITCKHS